MICRAGAAAAAALLLLAATATAAADHCRATPARTAEQQDKLLRFGSAVKAVLESAGAEAALVSRAGLKLERLGIRYSHAGVSLKASPQTPWAVRQLYFSCDEGKPLIFDQGLAAFVMGGDEPEVGYVSVLLLPPEAAAPLAQAALDKQRSLGLLGAAYSANAHAFSLQFQNCNQWLVELLATAWGSGVAGREQAQGWLRDAGYRPAVVALGWAPLMWASAFVPHLHHADHPPEDLAAARFRISLPAAVEAFVQQHVPSATRIELCHDSRHIVLRRAGPPIADGCVAEPGDEVTPLT